MKDILFIMLVTRAPPGTTENARLQYFTLKTNISVFKRPVAVFFFKRAPSVTEDAK
jgi:hypothetical protein